MKRYKSIRPVTKKKIKESFRLKPVDKNVIDAFYRGDVATSNLLTTNGVTLEKMGMGRQIIAVKDGYNYKIMAVQDTKSTEAILNYIYKTFPAKLIVEKKSISEADESEEKKAKDAIKAVIDTDWGGSNEDQYKNVQLLSGLSSNNSDSANKFMQKLNSLTSGLDPEDF